jgi:hypothetical protein
LSISSNQARERAAALFRKETQHPEGRQAMTEYEVSRRATSEKTARLRALRLARDAAAAIPTAPAPRSRPARTRAAVGK